MSCFFLLKKNRLVLAKRFSFITYTKGINEVLKYCTGKINTNKV